MRVEISTTYKHYLAGEKAVLELYGLGFNAIQLGAAHNEANLEKVKELKNDLHLKYSMHAPFPNPDKNGFDPSRPERTEKLFSQAIENAHFLNADPIVIHPGSFDKEKVNMENYTNLIGKLADKASDYNLTIGLENKTRRSDFSRDLKNIKQVIEQVESNNIGICFDTSHARTVCDTEDEVFNLFKKYYNLIEAVHLVDTHGKEDDHLPPAHGKVEIENIVSYCVDNKFEGPLTFEVSKVPEDMVIDGERFVREILAEGYFNHL